MRKGLLLGLMLILVVSLAGFPQEEGVGSGAVFRDGVDARALGMGGAFVAVADSYSASYWNPAGIAKAGGPRIGGMNTNKFGAGINFNFISGILTLEPMAVAGTFIGSTITGIEGTTGTITANEFLFLGSVAMPVMPGIYAGGSVKSYSYSYTGGEIKASASGFGFDVGALVTELIPGLSLGVAAFDVGGTKIKWTGTPTNPTDIVSAAYKLGAAYKVGENLIVASDLDVTGEAAGMVLRLGVELLFPPIAVRAGAISVGEALNFTVGAGLSLGQLKVDFAFVQNPAALRGVEGAGPGSFILSAEFVMK